MKKDEGNASKTGIQKDKTEYNPTKIELIWQAKWKINKIYQPDLDSATSHYYNLHMFPYPSAEGLHVGNVFAFTGADIYGRFKRMQGFRVFQPFGLDGFGIHSENYALKVGSHPMEQAEKSQTRFYEQVASIGSGYDWSHILETYDPDYYKWTQWLFTKLFKAGLAYRKKLPVNFCPSCKTVLADEQVISNLKSQISNLKNKEDVIGETIGVCERCGTEVERRDMEQWLFGITSYAEQLLEGLDQIDWTEKVKIAQRNWIGKSEGARVRFPLKKKYNIFILHAFKSSPTDDFYPWLKDELTKAGHTVFIPELPHTFQPQIEEEQIPFLLENYDFNEDTVIIGHSLGGVAALKLLPKLKTKIARLVLIASPIGKDLIDGKPRPEYNASNDWKFDYDGIKQKAASITVLQDTNDHIVPKYHGETLARELSGELIQISAKKPHFNSEQEPEVLKAVVPSIEVFTTRPDTLYGATFMVVSPEHPIIASLLNGQLTHSTGSAQAIDNGQLEKVREYVEQAKRKGEAERQQQKEKTGVFSGAYALNPINNEQIPIWIADYVLMGYGTGAIMAVPAHDERDFEFAKKYDLAVKQVVTPMSEEIKKEVYIGSGKLVNSGEWDGLEVPAQIGKVIEDLEKKGVGKKETNYHLRDWLISRQRYWGPPIPMIFCEACAKKGDSWLTTKEGKRRNGKWTIENGKSSAWNAEGWYPEETLPVLLPKIEDYRPLGTGKAPLANHPEFFKTTCPGCGKEARRETDVSDTFLDSSWYFLRYLATDLMEIPFPMRSAEGGMFKGASKEEVETSEKRTNWLPIDVYTGGAEHSVLHLLYARFVYKVLVDLGYIDKETAGDEPFPKFFAHGLIIKDGAKMSKSKGNVVVPDMYIKKYGADTLRMYLMFLGPFDQGGDFRDSGIAGMNRFLKRVWTLFTTQTISSTEHQTPLSNTEAKLVKAVTADIERFHYNTAISSIMIYYNYLSKQERLFLNSAETFLKLLAPFAPHMTEELYQRYVIASVAKQSHAIKEIASSPSDFIDIKSPRNDNFESIHLSSWPKFDAESATDRQIIIVIQVNGKLRGSLTVSNSGHAKQEIERLAKEQKSVQNHLQGKTVKNIIYVPGKVLNFVVYK